jgi:hypothetical protein
MTVNKTVENWRVDLQEMNFWRSEISLSADADLRKLFRTTIDTEGVDAQVLTAAEEAGEYNKACIRMVARPWDHDENIDRLVDETADVLIMLAQMDVIMSMEGPADWPERVRDRVRMKANRLRHRILAAMEGGR